MVSSERSSLDASECKNVASEYTLFQIEKYFLNYKNQFLGKELKNLGFFCSFFFQITSKINRSYKF